MVRSADGKTKGFQTMSIFYNKKSGLLHGASRFKQKESKKGVLEDWLKAFNLNSNISNELQNKNLYDLKDKVEKLELLLDENILTSQEKTVVQSEIIRFKQIISELKSSKK